MITGAYSLEELKTIRREVSEVLKYGGFDLAKWATNHSSLLTDTVPEKSLALDYSTPIKTLGMKWDPRNDVFHYSLDKSFDSLPPTKRKILSVTARFLIP